MVLPGGDEDETKRITAIFEPRINGRPVDRYLHAPRNLDRYVKITTLKRSQAQRAVAEPDGDTLRLHVHRFAAPLTIG